MGPWGSDRVYMLKNGGKRISSAMNTSINEGDGGDSPANMVPGCQRFVTANNT